MKAKTGLRASIPYVEFAAGCFAVYFGAQWALDPNGPFEPGFAISLAVLGATEIARRRLPANSVKKSKIDSFIHEGQELRGLATKSPLPIEKHIAWVDSMNKYFVESNAAELKTRLNDFSGLTFYGDVSEKSKYLRSIDGRIRRLMEFMQEIRSNN